MPKSRPTTPRPSAEERFWSNVHRTPLCWEWVGRIRDGYGRFRVGGHEVAAHRFAWTLLHGPVPAGLELDHLCRNRACVRPSHLEPVTRSENAIRGVTGWATVRNPLLTACRAGHVFDATNTIMRANGYRSCRACSKVRRDRWRQRQAS